MTDFQKLELMNEVVCFNERGPKKGIELSVVKKENCINFVYPTPFELHFSPMHLNFFLNHKKEYIQNMNGTDTDLAAHFTMIHEYGIVLYGEDIQKVFGSVPKKDFVNSIYKDIENATEEITYNPIYMTLNLCRVLAFLKEQLYLSKAEGGQWGIINLPCQFHDFILQVLESYQGEQMFQTDELLGIQFAEFMIKAIKYEMNKY